MINNKIRLLLDTIIEAIDSHNEISFIQSKILPGYIETTSVEDLHEKTPGFYLAHEGIGDTMSVPSGETDIVVRLVAYIIVVDKVDSLVREKTMCDLISQLSILISSNRWGLPFVHPAVNVVSQDLHGLSNGYKSDTSSWRTSVSVLARASDLYGGEVNPVTGLSLRTITWEQSIRVGDDLYKPDPHFPPVYVYNTMESQKDSITKPPKHTAKSVSIENKQLLIEPAIDESTITHYALYWGLDESIKIPEQPVIMKKEKEGKKLTIELSQLGNKPYLATHILVFSQNSFGEMKNNISVNYPSNLPLES
ncbi:hypothetical protein KCM76_16200 [Zooshikella marina]|uniref:hypothetical protein n=1 Tax=Zooshikella ganghwensis TaxID=202772 RepID=UPI001BAEFF64|nr:hypothetical protein [Zooshikella ganghwensis]MBU2707537.1 hypothetical protein [Zooshikella ganghwensis]